MFGPNINIIEDPTSERKRSVYLEGTLPYYQNPEQNPVTKVAPFQPQGPGPGHHLPIKAFQSKSGSSSVVFDSLRPLLLFMKIAGISPIAQLDMVFQVPIFLSPITWSEAKKLSRVLTNFVVFENMYNKITKKKFQHFLGNKPIVVTIGLPILACSTMVVTHVTMVHFKLLQIQEGLGVKDIGLAITAFFAAMMLLLISDEAHYASNCVKVQFQKKLLLVELNWMNDDAQQEINMFLRATEMNPTDMSLGGFFDVNRNLFKSLIATMVTYLVVLLQFQISIPEDGGPVNATMMNRALPQQPH
ncbi:unnamed protein product [Diabrotica balteata]|uniref:Gustatory receptor n=1 Tax=Diabrotica balteata TaxID=107213 RepID=A0A9N9SZB9_DIABA|nr:unnamed protein product [Diabrotica balteata]